MDELNWEGTHFRPGSSVPTLYVLERPQQDQMHGFDEPRVLRPHGWRPTDHSKEPLVAMLEFKRDGRFGAETTVVRPTNHVAQRQGCDWMRQYHETYSDDLGQERCVVSI
jgi:hypothetical protein